MVTAKRDKKSKQPKTDPRFYTLRDAAYFDLSAAAQVLRDNPSAIDARNSIGETAFHFLVVENALDAVQWLLEKGSDVNTRNNFGSTPLLEAASLGYVSMCEFLLSRGADIEPRNTIDETAISEAARYGHLEILKLLLAHLPGGADINTYFDEFDLEKLLAKGGDVVDTLSPFGLHERSQNWIIDI
jgi:ankyrin repeat protein